MNSLLIIITNEREYWKSISNSNDILLKQINEKTTQISLKQQKKAIIWLQKYLKIIAKDLPIISKFN